MIDRRRLLELAAASGAAGLAGGARAAPGAQDAALSALLQVQAVRLLEAAPELGQRFARDLPPDPTRAARLDDRSRAGLDREAVAASSALADLSRIDRSALSPAAARDLDVARFVFGTLKEFLGRYGYIDLNLRPSPYVVSQMNGAYYWLPDSLGGQSPLAGPADLDAWFSRLRAFATAIDQETERVRLDAAAGVVPPGFVIDRTLAQIARLRDSPSRGSALIAPVLARAAAAGLAEPGPRAEAIFHEAIAPALTRQIEALKSLRDLAVETAGAWRLPDGEAYYAAALRANTTVATSPAEMHRQGLAQVDALLAEIDAGLRAQGLTQGSVGERIGALNLDPRFRVSDDDTGRTLVLAKARAVLDDVTGRLPRAFSPIPLDPIIVRRVPEAIEQGAPGAFYQEGVDGRPGAFTLNLARPSEHTLWRLPTLAHHEGIPGHHYQATALRQAGALPLFRRMVLFSAYTEGWALYAQQVADEIGAFEADPFGRIGYLQSELFRAGRIVVDTGIHHARWSRDQAVDWMVSHIGEMPEATRREVDRYCVYPGQACSFKVGANAIVAARESARARLGARFDIRGFHDLVLGSGPVPMDVLAASSEAWTGG